MNFRKTSKDVNNLLEELDLDKDFVYVYSLYDNDEVRPEFLKTKVVLDV